MWSRSKSWWSQDGEICFFSTFKMFMDWQVKLYQSQIHFCCPEVHTHEHLERRKMNQPSNRLILPQIFMSYYRCELYSRPHIYSFDKYWGRSWSDPFSTKEKKRLNTIEPLGNLMEMKRNSWIMGQETLKRNPSFMTHSVLWIFHKCPRGAYGQAGKMGITHTHT